MSGRKNAGKATAKATERINDEGGSVAWDALQDAREDILDLGLDYVAWEAAVRLALNAERRLLAKWNDSTDPRITGSQRGVTGRTVLFRTFNDVGPPGWAPEPFAVSIELRDQINSLKHTRAVLTAIARYSLALFRLEDWQRRCIEAGDTYPRDFETLHRVANGRSPYGCRPIDRAKVLAQVDEHAGRPVRVCRTCYALLSSIDRGPDARAYCDATLEHVKRVGLCVGCAGYLRASGGPTTPETLAEYVRYMDIDHSDKQALLLETRLYERFSQNFRAPADEAVSCHKTAKVTLFG